MTSTSGSGGLSYETGVDLHRIAVKMSVSNFTRTENLALAIKIGESV